MNASPTYGKLFTTIGRKIGDWGITDINSVHLQQREKNGRRVYQLQKLYSNAYQLEVQSLDSPATLVDLI